MGPQTLPREELYRKTKQLTGGWSFQDQGPPAPLSPPLGKEAGLGTSSVLRPMIESTVPT